MMINRMRGAPFSTIPRYSKDKFVYTLVYTLIYVYTLILQVYNKK